jgi:DNA primase
MGEAGRAIVVEGYMDAIACHEVGLAEAVATMGTALTANHIDLLRRRTDRVVLAFDSDSAGMAAALRARELYQRAGITVQVAMMPEGSDPDSVIRAEGADAFRAYVDEAPPIVEWELARILSRAEGRPEQERMAAMREAVGALARVPAGVEREYYVRWLAERWAPDAPDRARTMEAAIREEIARRSARRADEPRRREDAHPGGGLAGDQSAGTPAANRQFNTLLAALAQHADLAAEYVPMVEPGDFPTEEHQEIWRALGDLVGGDESLDLRELAERVSPGAREIVAEVALDERLLADVGRNVAGAVNRLIAARLGRQAEAHKERLAKAESDEERESIRRELSELARRRSELTAQTTLDEE